MSDNRKIKLSGCLGDVVTIIGLITTVLSLGFTALAITRPDTVMNFINIGPTATAHIVTQVVEVITSPEAFEVTREVEVTRVVRLEQQVIVTATPVPPTETPEVKVTPTDIPPGTVLSVGETWYQGGMEARISNVNFAANCYNSTVQFEISILNNSGQTLVMNVTNKDVRVLDNNNAEYYPNYCLGINTVRYIESSLEAGAEYTEKLSLRPILQSSTKQLIFIIEKAGRIKNARWAIDVPR